MELIVEHEAGSSAVAVETGADLSRHTLGSLRRALGLATPSAVHDVSLADVGLHRAMVFRDDESLPASAHLEAGWRPDHRGRFSVVRPPHQAPVRPVGPERLEPPPDPDPPPPIPFATVLPMLILSGLMAVLWSPMFAMLSAASAMIPLGRALGPRMMMPRTRRRHAEALELHQQAVFVAETTWLLAVADWLERRVNSPGTLDRLVSTATLRPWTRRLPIDGALGLSVGRGELDVQTDEGQSLTLRDVPLVLDIDRGLGVTGDRAEVLALARWITLEAAVRHGPADLVVSVVTTSDRLSDWEWTRWLPALGRVAVGVDAIDAVCRMAEDRTSQHLVVVDGVVPTGTGVFARLLGGHVESARVLWLGRLDEVPAVCADVVEVTADGFVRSSDGRASGWAWRLGADEAEEFARFLAPFSDPEVAERVAPLPDSAPLAQLCPIDDPDGSEASLRNRWAQAGNDELLVPIGVTADGPLVMDFVVDGPHALVAGTTGSGKSELLRSLVVGAALTYSPDRLSFVLIDFKGGGAFDAVAGLPHVAAVVTDLEPEHARRALRSLRAELQHRELLLRHHGASDLASLGPTATAPPRLMVIVDEFAALADELPEFLDGLVDVARRGRSLGVHLVLATQRPAGVVTAEIRTNTNLRICLRVRDGADSVDVIDRVDAASLPSIPGRAIVTVGGERQRFAQIAYLAGAPLLEARPFTLEARPKVDDEAHRWLDRVIELVAQCHPERVRAPWLPPLPPTLAADRLWTIGNDSAPGHPTQAALLGVLDDPDRRAQLPLIWSPSDGGLVVAAADPDRVASTLSTVVASLALDHPDLDVVILDGGGGTLDRLGVLRSVADVIPHRQPERLARALTVIDRRRRGWADRQRAAMVVVINRWGPIADALGDALGPDAGHQLAQIFGDSTIVPVIGVTSDREVPSKVLTSARRRLVHHLADANAGLAFDVHPTKLPAGGAAVYDVESRLHGVIAELSDHGLARVAAWSRPEEPPSPIQVLAEHMPLTLLPDGHGDDGSWSVPIGFDEDLAPVFVELTARQRFVVLGRPGSGRSTAVAAVAAGLARLGAGDRVELIDDADRLANADVAERLAEADSIGRPVVLSASPTTARAFGSWLAPMMGDAVVLLINPSRLDAEAVRVVIPDLSRQPPGRSVLLDRGRATILHIATDRAA